jgi:hypothetical protein
MHGPTSPFFHSTLPFTISFNHACLLKRIDSNALPLTTSFNHAHLLKLVDSKTIKSNRSQIKHIICIAQKLKTFFDVKHYGTTKEN